MLILENAAHDFCGEQSITHWYSYFVKDIWRSVELNRHFEAFE